MNKKHILTALIALVVAFGAATTEAEAQSWTAPSAAPPSGNTASPLDTSGTAQTKAAGIILNTAGATNGLIVYLGNVGIGVTSPSYKLQVAGTVGATAYYYTSDERLKKDIADLSPEASLANVLKLQGVSFDWKTDSTPSVGLIAQDVEKVYPQLVHTDAQGYKSVEYGNLVGPLVEAIKAQQSEINALKLEIAELKAAK